MQEVIKIACFDPEYLHSFIKENSRIPFYLRKHIEHCDLCMEHFLVFDQVAPISKNIFGKPFHNIIKNTNVIVGDKDSEIQNKTFFGRLQWFFLKYKAPIEIVAYGSILFGIIELFLYLMN